MKIRHQFARPGSRRRPLAILLFVATIALGLVPWPIAPASAAAAPTLTLDPASGSCATRPVARGAGFPAGSTIAIFVIYPTPRHPGGDGTQIAQATADGAGTFSATLPIVGCGPDEPDGTRFIISAGVAATDGPFAQASFTIDRTTPGRCFAETGYCIRGRFLDYWRADGLDLGDRDISVRESLALFGYPLSGEFEQHLEDGNTYVVQYFERARFELHPLNALPYDVLFGQFGRRIVAGVPGAPTAPVPPSSRPGTTYFPETGHNVGPDFSLFWARNGGLAVFGYPLSEPFEQRLEDGKTYTVQYFERARLEQHPAQEGMPYNIQLGQFGRRILAETGGGR